MLIGPTRVGKTLWARSLGPHIYWANSWNAIELVDSQSLYVVLDDCDFDYLPVWISKGLWGGQESFVASDKYTKKISISNWRKPLIFIVNPDQDPRFSTKWKNWHSDNCVVVEINKELFKYFIQRTY